MPWTSIFQQDAATETTLAQGITDILAALATQETAINDSTTVLSADLLDILNALGDKATEATLAQGIADLIDAVNNSAAPAGVATEAKQDDMVALLTAISGEDFASEATLDALLTISTAINTAHQNGGVTYAQLTAIKDAIDNLTIDTTGQATEAKQDTQIAELDDLQARVGEISLTPTANTVLARLKDIYEAVDGLEISLDTLNLSADQIELGTDELEAKTDAVKASVDALKTSFDSEDFSTETTLAAFKTEAKAESDATQALISTEAGTTRTLVGEVSATPTANTVLARLKDISDQLGGSGSSDPRLDTVIAELQDIEADVEAFLTAFNAEDFASEATLAAFKAEAKAESDATQTLVGEVSATPTANTVLARLKDIYEAVDGLEVSLGDINVNTDELEGKLDTLNTLVTGFRTDFGAENFASEATLTSLDTAIGELNTGHKIGGVTHQQLLDIKNAVDAIATDNTGLATEAKQDQVISALGTLNAVDFATEAELASFKAAMSSLIGEVSLTPTANTVLERLKKIYEGIDGVEALLGSVDLNTDELEAKLDSVVAEITSFRTDFAGEDFATEATQAVLSGYLNEINTGHKLGGVTHQQLLDIKTAIDNLTFDSTGLSTEAKQDDLIVLTTAVKLAVEAVDTALQNGGVTQAQLEAIRAEIASQSFDTSLLATEAKQDAQIVIEGAIQTAVESLEAAHQTGGITHAQLESIRAEIEGLLVEVSGITREAQLLHSRADTGEEIRYARDVGGVKEYIMMAPHGTDPAAETWDVAEIEFTDTERFLPKRVIFTLSVAITFILLNLSPERLDGQDGDVNRIRFSVEGGNGDATYIRKRRTGNFS